MHKRILANAKLHDPRKQQPIVHNLTAIVTMRNNESTIANCISRLKPCVDDVIVMDENSNDRSIAIAREYGAYVVPHSDRDALMEMLRTEWSFTIDAESRLSETLTSKLANVVAAQPFEAEEVTIRRCPPGLEQESEFRPLRLVRTQSLAVDSAE